MAIAASFAPVSGSRSPRPCPSTTPPATCARPGSCGLMLCAISVQFSSVQCFLIDVRFGQKKPGEWILAAGATAAQNKWVGLVKRVGVLPFHARQRDYLLPLSALPVLVHWYTEVQGTGRSLRQAVRRRRCDRRFGLACCSPSSGLQHDLRALSTSRLAVCAAQARWQAEVRERIRDAAKDHLPACRAYVREPMVMLRGTVG